MKKVIQFLILLCLVGIVSVSLFNQPLEVSKKEQRSTSLPSAEQGQKKASVPELLRYEKGKASEGFTLYPVSGNAEVQLLSMEGKVLHTWHLDADRARLLPNGNLLVLHGSKWGLTKKKWKKLRHTLREYNWDGEVVWEHHVAEVAHHDLQRLPNGNTLFLQRTELPRQMQESLIDPLRRAKPTRSDRIVEVSPDGREVWSWEAHNHLDPNDCGKDPCPAMKQISSNGKKSFDWTHMNTLSLLPENQWYDQGDERFRPGNILASARNLSTIFIIDKVSGEVVWRYEGEYRGGFSGVHDPLMIAPGLEGAGNILVFDNGRTHHQGESFVLELNPVTSELVWVYDAGKSFFSRIAGSQERLPNGNTLIAEDDTGRLFEVTREKEIVWEYQGVFRSGRPKRYPYDHCPQFRKLM